MFRSNSNDLEYLIQQFSEFESISKSARLASRIANIYLQRNDHKNAMEYLGYWLDFEPENEQVHRIWMVSWLIKNGEEKNVKLKNVKLLRNRNQVILQ